MISTSLTNETQLLYLHRYLYGGATAFTAHLMHMLSKLRRNNIVLRVCKTSEMKQRDFGYGLNYMNISKNVLSDIDHPFIVIFKDKFLPALISLNKRTEGSSPLMVIHDYRDVSDSVLPFIKDYKLITMRKSVQNFLKVKYELNSDFMYQPFYPYPAIIKKTRNRAVSISRISFEKNIDIILAANKMLDDNLSVMIYGCPSRIYVHKILGSAKAEFNKYYFGMFQKSFSTLTDILSQAKFVVDLSVLKHDGGGTQYTFLEAIHNKCALILHRKWLENEDLNPSYCDFREGYNCFAVDNAEELAELIRGDQDTTRIIENACKLLKRHINSPWSNLLHL
jgi:glycosyltransferase involved in cell wall biosynthesis